MPVFRKAQIQTLDLFSKRARRFEFVKVFDCGHAVRNKNVPDTLRDSFEVAARLRRDALSHKLDHQSGVSLQKSQRILEGR
jgi:hypothetical protein